VLEDRRHAANADEYDGGGDEKIAVELRGWLKLLEGIMQSRASQ
jgi:hypothetical protein